MGRGATGVATGFPTRGSGCIGFTTSHTRDELFGGKSLVFRCWLPTVGDGLFHAYMGSCWKAGLFLQNNYIFLYIHWLLHLHGILMIVPDVSVHVILMYLPCPCYSLGSFWKCTAQAHFHSHICPCGICGGQCGNWTGVAPSTLLEHLLFSFSHCSTFISNAI
jgi:hypothetical protein